MLLLSQLIKKLFQEPFHDKFAAYNSFDLIDKIAAFVIKVRNLDHNELADVVFKNRAMSYYLRMSINDYYLTEDDEHYLPSIEKYLDPDWEALKSKLEYAQSTRIIYGLMCGGKFSFALY